MLRVPVVLIIFRRPRQTERVLRAIAQAQPRQLFVVADGPRPDRPQEVQACAATRAVIDQVDWDCEVIKNYSEVNLGCGERPATGISWVFDQVPEAIILEDDCLPHPSFFQYCEELLEKYREDERIMHIAGSNFLSGARKTPFSYYFSCLNNGWGWATWRRAWRYFDHQCKLWPMLKDTSWLTDILEDERAVEVWRREFEYANRDPAYNRGVWDFQWTFAVWANSGLSILPKENLVSNIGCCEDATHTVSAMDVRANLPTVEMGFPLMHPPNVLRATEVDRKAIQEMLPGFVQPVNSGRNLHRVVSRLLPGAVKRALRRATAWSGG